MHTICAGARTKDINTRIYFVCFACACSRTRRLTASNQQRCHAERTGPHHVLKTTKISLRTRITTELLVRLCPLPHPISPILPLSPSHTLCMCASLSRPLPPPSLAFLVFHRVPPELFKVAATIWVTLLGPISANPFRHAHIYTHPPLCVLPDTARWERLHYRVELCPCFDCLAREQRRVVCMCE